MNRNDLPAPNTTCKVCGRQYRRCKTCAQLRNRGIEAWREYCDSPECYQTYILSQMDDVSSITMEDYERVMAYELPEGRKPVDEIAEKLEEVKKKLEERENAAKKDNSGDKKGKKYKAYDGYDKDDRYSKDDKGNKDDKFNEEKDVK